MRYREVIRINKHSNIDPINTIILQSLVKQAADSIPFRNIPENMTMYKVDSKISIDSYKMASTLIYS